MQMMHKSLNRTARRSTKIASAIAAISLLFTLYPTGAQAADAPGVDFNLSVAGTLLRDGSTVNQGTTVKVGSSSLLKEGTGNRELRVKLDPGLVYQSGGVTAPEGWTIEYSTNNGTSWVSSEPSPASGVTDVRATKSALAAGPIVSGSQIFSSETVTPIPASTFTGSTGGDGWDVFFYEDYVLNIFHHDASAIKLNCLLRSTGALCPGFNPNATSGAAFSQFAGYMAGDRSGGWALTTTGKVYAFTSQTSTNTPGVLCINVTTAPPSNCGFVALDSTTNVNSYLRLSNAEGAGGRLFGIETANKKLLCFDPTTNLKCANSPVTLSGSSTDAFKYHVYPLGDKVFASTDTNLYCFESSSLAACAGAWPVSYTSLSWTSQNISPVAHMNSSGTIDGVCMWNGCLDLTGAARTGAGWVNPHSITTWSTNAGNNSSSGRYGRFEATSGRAYLQKVLNGHEIFCFDYATEAACAGFDTTPKPADTSTYAVRADPNNPGCVWYNTDPGKIGLFDAYTGDPTCAGNPVITLQPSSFAPRYACSTTRGVDEWTLVKLKSLAGTGAASAIKLTVRDPLGNAVAGWTDRAVTIGASYDMTGLDVGTSGSRPTFNFAFTGVTGGTITSATVSLDYMGKGPELCVNTVLSAGASVCPVVSGTTTTFIDSVGGSSTYTKSRSLTIGTDPAACAESIRVMAVPGPPRNPTTISDSLTAAKVVYETPADDGGSPILDYKYSMDDGVTWLTANPTVRPDGKLEFSLSSLTAASTYAVKILATNAIGRSTSVTTSVTTLATLPTTTTSTVAPATTTTTTTTTVAPKAVVVAAAPVATTTTTTTVAPVVVAQAVREATPVVLPKLPVTGLQESSRLVYLALALMGVGSTVVATNRRRLRSHM
jgi:microcystin-dependent protein